MDKNVIIERLESSMLFDFICTDGYQLNKDELLELVKELAFSIDSLDIEKEDLINNMKEYYLCDDEVMYSLYLVSGFYQLNCINNFDGFGDIAFLGDYTKKELIEDYGIEVEEVERMIQDL